MITRWLYRLINRNWWQVPLVAIAVIIALMFVIAMLAGCGTARDLNRTVIKQGVDGGQPVAYIERTTETEDTAVVLPDAAAVLQAAAGAAPSATPWGAIASTAVSLLGGAFVAQRYRRQRNELIDGVEAAKGELDTTAWTKVKNVLAAAQSADTQHAVWNRTP